MSEQMPGDRSQWVGPVVPLRESYEPPPEVDLVGGDEIPAAPTKSGRRRPQDGWRAGVHVLTGGRISPQPSRRALELEQLIADIRTASTARPFSTAFACPKGGVGKTTSAAEVGSRLGEYRSPEPVLLVETNPHLGSSQSRLRISNPLSIYDLVAWMNHIKSAGGNEDAISSNQLEAFLSNIPERNLKVLAAPAEAALRDAMTRDDLRRVFRVLFRHYPNLILDTGTDILHPSAHYVLEQVVDQIVVVTKGADGKEHGRVLLNRLLQLHGRTWVRQRVLVAVNCVRGSSLARVKEQEEMFGPHVAGVFRIAFDSHLDEGDHVDPGSINPRTRRDFLQVAAAVGRGYKLGGSPRVDPWLRPKVEGGR